MSAALPGLHDDLICRIFASRVLHGRRVCKAIKAALFKAGTCERPLILRVISPVGDWNVFRAYSHVKLYVSSDVELEQCRLAGVAAVRVVGLADIDNAVAMDARRTKPTHKYLWSIANDIADKVRPLPRFDVLQKLVGAISKCQYVQSLVHYRMTRRLLGCVHNQEIFTLGLQLRVMFGANNVYSVMLLHDLASHAALCCIVDGFRRAPEGLVCNAQTVVDVVAHASDMTVPDDALLTSGCVRVIVDLVAGARNTLPPGFTSRGTWVRDMQHSAITSLAFFLNMRCEMADDLADALLQYNVIRAALAAACSGDFYLARPACILLHEMCMFDRLCAGMLVHNVLDVMAWVCKKDLPQAVDVMSQLMHYAITRKHHSCARLLPLYLETVRFMRDRYGQYYFLRH